MSFLKTTSIVFLLITWSVSAFSNTCDSNIAGGLAISMPSSINYTGGRETTKFITSGWQVVTSAQSMVCNLSTGSGVDVQIYGDVGLDFSGQSISYNGVSYRIFNTGTPGIGLIGEVRVTGDYIPLSNEKSMLLRSVRVTSSKYYFGLSARIQLVALKPLKPGILNFSGVPVLLTQRVGAPIANNSYSKVSVSSTSINVKNASCTLNIPASVNLPRIDSSVFQSINSTAGDTTFVISAVCDGAYDNYQVSYNMTDANSTINSTTNLTLESASGAAKGVALQVLENKSPIAFGPPQSLLSRKPFGAVLATGGSLTKNLVVRYIRTDPALTPGIVRAGITLTLSYQ